MKRLMMAVACVCFLSIPAGDIEAAEPTIVIQKDGSMWYSAGDGSPTIEVKNIIHPPGTTPQPPDPDDPDPPISGMPKIEQKMLDAANAVDDSRGAHFLAAMYELLAENIENGKIPAKADAVREAFKRFSEETLDLMPGDHEDDWEEVDRIVTDELALWLLRNNRNLTAAQYAAFFNAAASGLKKSTGDNILPDLLKPLIEALIKVLIQILTELIDSGFGLSAIDLFYQSDVHPVAFASRGKAVVPWLIC